MSNIAIKVEGLSKLYKIGKLQRRHDTLRDRMADARVFNLFKRRYGQNGNSQSAIRNSQSEDLWALKEVSFEVKRGEVVGVIGRNGAGKSTLLKILSRITEPTEGYADINGRVGSLLEVGTGFHPELTGRENIYLNGSILGMRRAEIQSKLDEMIAFAEIEKFIDTPVKHYSSGMYVRLAFAVAAHLEPETLLVDEVLAVGDMAFQKKCLGKMQDVAMEGRTVLFVSHNMSAIAGLCSSAILLENGRIIRKGFSGEVVASYLSTSIGASARAEWTDLARAPGNDGFRLSAVSLLDGEKKPTSLVDIEAPTTLQIEYYLSNPGLSFRCAAIFHTQGVVAFTTVEPKERFYAQAGWFAATLTIPGNLLSEGDYTISISAFHSRGKKMHYCKANDVVAFQVYDSRTTNSARGDYLEGFSGVLRPLLVWAHEVH